MRADKVYGRNSEDAAVAFLRRQGYKILERNFRTRLGEIDIVARHKGTLVFVEVKARRSLRYGHPKLAVTAAKQRTLSLVALIYLKKHATLETRARFDVVTLQTIEGKTEVELFANAFEMTGLD
jgi:putative endonuclease